MQHKVFFNLPLSHPYDIFVLVTHYLDKLYARQALHVAMLMLHSPLAVTL